MSSRLRLRSHGVYVNAKPDCSSENTRLEALKCKEFALGDNATPTSPIAPDLASGVIRRKGTALNIIFSFLKNCAKLTITIKYIQKITF